jgi:hypothetical protein
VKIPRKIFNICFEFFLFAIPVPAFRIIAKAAGHCFPVSQLRFRFIVIDKKRIGFGRMNEIIIGIADMENRRCDDGSIRYK